MLYRAAVALLALGLSVAGAVTVGDKLPSINLHHGFPPTEVDLATRSAGKKIILVGLPGAFTPT
jgi:peroxiredoxin